MYNVTIARGAKDVIAAKHETAEGSVDRFWEEVLSGQGREGRVSLILG